MLLVAKLFGALLRLLQFAFGFNYLSTTGCNKFFCPSVCDGLEFDCAP